MTQYTFKQYSALIDLLDIEDNSEFLTKLEENVFKKIAGAVGGAMTSLKSEDEQVEHLKKMLEDPDKRVVQTAMRGLEAFAEKKNVKAAAAVAKMHKILAARRETENKMMASAQNKANASRADIWRGRDTERRT